MLGYGNGLLVLGNGPHLLGNMSQFGILLHSVSCRIRGYVIPRNAAIGLMSFSIVSFGVMSFGLLPYQGIFFEMQQINFTSGGNLLKNLELCLL